MSKRRLSSVASAVATAAVCVAAAVAPSTALAQKFDFANLESKAREFSVTIDMNIEVSFGVHSSEQTERYLGTIVSDSGLVIFDGSAVGADATFPSFSGFSVKTKPVSIEVTTLDGKSYLAEYIGYDRYTNIGFLQIQADGETFKHVEFKKAEDFQIGQWLCLYMLLPEFINPPLAADVGMISAQVTAPEKMPLTVGFNSLQATSVLFDESLEPVGVLGALTDPAASGSEGTGMGDPFGQFGIPLLGVITADRLEELIANPPRQGETNRGWLGITLQALTRDIAEFWDLDIPGGIIVNDVVKDSPAREAGLAVGDIIYEVNGQPIEVDKEEKLPLFQRMISDLGPGASLQIGALRRSETGTDSIQTTVTLIEAPISASDAEELEVDEFEFKVRNLVFADYMITNQDPDEFDGVVISEIEMGGLADLSGLQIGDVLQRISATDVASIEDVRLAVDELKEIRPREVILFVWRGGKTMFINMKTDW